VRDAVIGGTGMTSFGKHPGRSITSLAAGLALAASRTR
jgi:hypothetical protein